MIQINKRWAIRKSKMALCLCQSQKRHGEIIWIDRYFFSKVADALEKLVDMAILRGIEKGSWEDVVSEVKQTRAEISHVREALNGLT